MTTPAPDYIRYMQRRRLARGTIYARRRELTAWLDHIGDRWPVATRHDVERWLDTTPHYTPRSVATRVSHLHQFYRWAMRESLATDDPTMLVDRPRVPVGQPRPAGLSAAADVIEQAPAPIALAMLLMLDAGLRCVEVTRARWSDVDLERGVILVHGKGGRDRYVGLPDRLRRALYVQRPDAGDGPVFGREVSPARMSRIVAEHVRACGHAFTAHQLRHAYGTRMLAATGNLRVVQQALGHASLNSTQVYAGLDDAAAAAAARLLVA